MAHYLFDPDTIHQIALQYIGLPHQQMFEQLTAALDLQYPGLISHDLPWIFSNAGGAMIQIKLLHASFNEYILLFGTPVGTEGHSGRHRVEFYDTVLDGEAWYYHEGQFERDVYTTGSRIFVGRGQSAGMHIPDHVWMIEYARGALGLSLPFGLADSVLSTLDYLTVWRTLVTYARLIARTQRSQFSSTLLARLLGTGFLVLSFLAVLRAARRERRWGTATIRDLNSHLR